MIDIVKIMQELSKTRPVFHSEADFQHALAWEIHKVMPDSNIRLEYPFRREKDYHLDIFASDNNVRVAIELKYKTILSFILTEEGAYYLKGHGAQDHGRYDYWRDVERLEEVVSARNECNGYSILLTNDSAYWNPSNRGATACDDFRLSEGGKVSGILNWGKNAGKGTTKGREAPISINGNYTCDWHDYSEFQKEECVQGGLRFRYLVLEINKERLVPLI